MSNDDDANSRNLDYLYLFIIDLNLLFIKKNITIIIIKKKYNFSSDLYSIIIAIIIILLLWKNYIFY